MPQTSPTQISVINASTVLNCSDAGNGDAILNVDTFQPGTNGKFYIHIQFSIFPVS